MKDDLRKYPYSFCSPFSSIAILKDAIGDIRRSIQGFFDTFQFGSFDAFTEHSSAHRTR